jgi:phage terminase small subunit
MYEVNLMTKGLTTKQELFVQEYTKNFNATQAAIRAGYSKKTAAVIGCENLVKPNIAERVKVLVEERSKKIGLDADEILAEIKKLALEDDSVPVHTKLRALEIAGKHLGLWDRDQEKAPRVQIVLEGRDLLT